MSSLLNYSHWYLPLSVIRYGTVIILFYAAGFLYENEEGRWQNRLEEWWVRIDDKKKSSTVRITIFAASAAALAGRAFDLLFGKKLFSVRSVLASVCYSIASFHLFVWFAYVLRPQQLLPMSFLESWGAAGLYFALGALPSLYSYDGREGLRRRLWGYAVCISLLTPLMHRLPIVGLLWGPWGVFRIVLFLLFLFGFSFGCDVLYIALTRWMLRRVSSSTELGAIAFIVFVDSLLGLFLCLGPSILGTFGAVITAERKAPAPFGMASVAFFIFGSALNFVDAIAWSLPFVFVLLLLLHRIVWPLIERPLYASARFGVIKNKKLLWTLGVSLLFAPQGAGFIKWCLTRI